MIKQIIRAGTGEEILRLAILAVPVLVTLIGIVLNIAFFSFRGELLIRFDSANKMIEANTATNLVTARRIDQIQSDITDLQRGQDVIIERLDTTVQNNQRQDGEINSLLEWQRRINQNSYLLP